MAVCIAVIAKEVKISHHFKQTAYFSVCLTRGLLTITSFWKPLFSYNSKLRRRKSPSRAKATLLALLLSFPLVFFLFRYRL